MQVYNKILANFSKMLKGKLKNEILSYQYDSLEEKSSEVHSTVDLSW